MMELTDETKLLLELYFDAAANLYGIIPLSKLLMVYNSQNDPISEEAFLAFSEELEEKHKFFSIIGEDEFYADVDVVEPINRDLVAEYIVYDADEGDQTYYQIKEAQVGKPYFVPDKEKFLKYADDEYIEKCLSFISFRAFLRNLPQFTRERADEVAADIYLAANIYEGTPEDLIKYICIMKVEVDAKQLHDLVPLYVEMHRDIRLHIHCGHTQNELEDLL